MSQRCSRQGRSPSEQPARRPLPSPENVVRSAVPSFEPWRTFLPSVARICVNSFGGPVAQLGVMHEEAVTRRQWVMYAQFVHLLNFANLRPGSEALETLIHLGRLRPGVWGGIVAGLLFVLPGFLS